MWSSMLRYFFSSCTLPVARTVENNTFLMGKNKSQKGMISGGNASRTSRAGQAALIQANTALFRPIIQFLAILQCRRPGALKVVLHIEPFESVLLGALFRGFVLITIN